MRLIGLAVVLLLSLLAPLAGEAQQPTTPRVAFLLMGSSQAGLASAFDAFREGLREFGWTEDQNIAIEYRWAGENPNRLPELAADLVRNKVDVIIASTPGVLAAQRITNSVPIIMCIADDAVKQGLVTNLARPGANITEWLPSPRSWLENGSNSCGRLHRRCPALPSCGTRRDPAQII
jgi:ABC-type uncharacterized transport system substrate-binding protein